MGNFVSQCVAGAGAGPLVVGPDGCRLRLGELAGVAELMIELPGHVVARATDVTKERRVRALAADEVLRAGEAYLLVPAERAGARLGEREMEAISRIVSGKEGSKGSRSGRRIFPEAEAEAEAEARRKTLSKGMGLGVQVHRRRPWPMGFGPGSGGPPLTPSMRCRFVDDF